MKLLHVVSYVSLRYGGPPHAVRKITEAMRSHGIDACCWGTGEKADRDEISKLPFEFKVFPVAWPRSWFRSPKLAEALGKEVNSFDVLHLNEVWTYPLFAAAKASQKNAKPYVMTLHGILTQPWRYNTLKKRLYLWLIGNKMLTGAACLHALTSAEEKGFRQAGYRGPVTIVPNGIDLDEFAHLPDREAAEEFFPELKGRRMVHFLSRLSPEKGLDELLSAWAVTVRQPTYDDCVLVLSGPDHNGYRSSVESLIESCGLVGKVLLTGMVHGFKKKALISRSDVYVLPSYSEGFSVSVLENLAAGKPALITPSCNFPDLTDSGAGICVLPEGGAIAEGLRSLLDMSSEDLQAMGARGRRLVQQKYQLDIAARKLITVYNCILQGKEIPIHPEPISLEKATKPTETP